MTITLDDLLSQLSPEDREDVENRTLELIEEEATLRELREALGRSQEHIASQLGVKQSAVSKLERRTDMYLSTLRKVVQAMGGELEIVARFPDHPPVRITQFRHLAGEMIRQD